VGPTRLIERSGYEAMPSLRYELRSNSEEPTSYYWQIVTTKGNIPLARSTPYAQKREAEAALNLVYYESREATYMDYT
jgi:hypothetical protein